MSDLLDEIIQAQKLGQPRGITSICSAHPWVLRAAMHTRGTLLIESTCNQVNQFGGYTGLTPQGFASYVVELAKQEGFPLDQLVLGGDHLGPSVWQDEPASSAMHKAEDLVRACVQAGYSKIHLDASMKLGDDDPSLPLDVEQVAWRASCLAKSAENAWQDNGQGPSLRYVIGSEVPIPGGALGHAESAHVTHVEDVQHMLEATQLAFARQGLDSAWQRVIAVVVEPGVEFGDDFVLAYDPTAAQELSRFIQNTPFVYEAHSTDYQALESLRLMVGDHFAILKVGPALTYAFRQAVFALARVEQELILPDRRSRIVQVLDEAMLANPSYWIKHYRGTEEQVAHARKFSLSDRIRYYWTEPSVQASLDRLLLNLGEQALPASLLGDNLPPQVLETLGDSQVITAREVLLATVSTVLSEYARACSLM